MSALRRIARNVADIAGAARFYAEALGFSRSGGRSEDAELAHLLGAERVATEILRLGSQEIELTQCFPPGAAYDRADANFVHFQHIALLAADIHAAYDKALAFGAEAISEQGPVQLPASSGGVIAVKFRDPDGHPLEFIQKPATGYDHSAISVANVERSVGFYAALDVGRPARQRNCGPEQEKLDALEDVDVDVVALYPAQATPHVELLRYRRPRAVPCHWGVRDLCADRLVFAGQPGELRLLRDPDGHVVLIDGRAPIR